MLNYTFDWDAEGFSYADDMFRGTSVPTYAVSQISGGTIAVLLGGQDTVDVGSISGGWSTSVLLTEQVTAAVTFDYQISHSTGPEPNEYGEVLFALDGQLFGTSGNDYVDRLTPPTSNTAGSTGWQTVTLNLGTLDSGMHRLDLGGLMASKTSPDELFTIEFDNFAFDVVPTGQGPSDPEPAPTAGTSFLTFADDVFKFGNSADNVGGGLGNDHLTGAGGNDMLFGAEGADVLTGGNHDDTLSGGTGNDILRGGNGDDILWGGAGKDVLHGDGAAGGGADTFCFSSNSMGSFDIIKDFDAAEGDRLDFSNVVTGFDPLNDNVRDFVKFQDLGLRTIVRVDVDGPGGSPGFVKVAVLHGVTGLDAEAQLYADGTLML